MQAVQCTAAVPYSGTRSRALNDTQTWDELHANRRLSFRRSMGCFPHDVASAQVIAIAGGISLVRPRHPFSTLRAPADCVPHSPPVTAGPART